MLVIFNTRKSIDRNKNIFSLKIAVKREILFMQLALILQPITLLILTADVNKMLGLRYSYD